MLNKAKGTVEAKSKPAKLTPEQVRLQECFTNVAVLGGNEALSELAYAITGFKPRTTLTRVVPFEVFYVGGNINRTALCVYAQGNQVYGCLSPLEGRVSWDATCRLATKEETEAFLEQNVRFWNDAAFMQWFATNVGAQFLQLFLASVN